MLRKLNFYMRFYLTQYIRVFHSKTYLPKVGNVKNSLVFKTLKEKMKNITTDCK